VIKSLKENGMKIGRGEIIKLGRAKLRVADIVIFEDSKES